MGAFILVSVNSEKGKAIVHSTTPFDRNIERGILRGGMSVTGDLYHVAVDNTYDEDVFFIDFSVIGDETDGSKDDIDEQVFLGAETLGINHRLSGVALQQIFFRYKQLEDDLKRQTEFWKSTNETLSQAMVQLQERETQLQAANTQLHAAQSQSERLKAAIIDVALDAVITIDDQSQIVEFSASAERIFGYQRTAVLGRLLPDLFIPPHLRDQHREGLKRYLDTGQSRMIGQPVTTEALHADGHTFPIELSISAVHVTEQWLFTAYIRDITESARMEQALRESERRFRSLAEAHPVPIGIAGLDAEQWLYVSPSLAELIGCLVDALLGTPPRDLFANEAEREELQGRLRTGGTVDAFEFTLCKWDRSFLPAAMTAKHIEYEGAMATVGGIIDLTEKKQAETEIERQREALYQSEKLSALGSLLAGVAHELNNPLSIVVGRSIMLEMTAANAEVTAAAGQIREAAERCTRIVKTFLAMARRQPPERTPVNLNDLIIAALELLGYSLRTASIEVRLELDPDLPDLLADASQLNQVFTNLFINAQQALLDAPEPRTLHVSTRYDQGDNTLHAVVADNGPGIPEAIRSRIFEPFFTTKPVGSGTGVGLSLSHGIIAAHDGTLSLENPVTGGTRFVIILPHVAVEVAKAVAQVPSEAPTTSMHILVVDDEPAFAEMLRDILNAAGHQVSIASSGRVALEHIAQQQVDVILSDLHMPDINGPDFYRELEQSYPHMISRLAFITGDTLGSVARRFLDDVACPYLDKPCTPLEVMQLIEQLAT